MARSGSSQQVNDAMTRYGLSERAAENSLQDLPWDSVEKLNSNLWTPDNPEGLVYLGVAENPLMRQEVAAYITKHFSVDPKDHLSYGVGPRGSPRLRNALALFFNSSFHAREPVLEQELLVLPGVVAVIDALAWSICNDGEGIIVPLPFYTGFKPAVGERARGVLIPAPFQLVPGYRGLDDIFDPEINRMALSNALVEAEKGGVKARAVMISNPHNPLGRCYPVETLIEIAGFCGRNNLHLIVDQIFANSVYHNPKAPHAMGFTSVLSQNLGGYIDPKFVHVAYGMGKDFCATGFRLGVLCSRNEGLLKAVSSISVFGWVPYVVQDMWAKMLEDETFLTDFMDNNRRRLAEQSAILVSFLEQRNIPYYTNVNAGVFIWVDLRRYLHVESVHDETTGQSSIYQESDQEREMRLSKRFLANGVGISPGSGFSTEELGWFRVGFSVEKQALVLGLQRLLGCLQSIEAEAGKSVSGVSG